LLGRRRRSEKSRQSDEQARKTGGQQPSLFRSAPLLFNDHGASPLA
jgi:hypothetical protein